VDKLGRVYHKILSQQDWIPTLQLSTLITALEFELVHLLSSTFTEIEEPKSYKLNFDFKTQNSLLQPI